MILISGEALIDLIPDPQTDQRYDAVLGGSPFNVAIGLGRLGAPVGFISRLSKDPNGEALAGALAADGVDLGLVERTAQPSTLAFVMRGTAQTGSRYSFYIDSTSARLRRSILATPTASPRRCARRWATPQSASIPTSARW